jgi:hypothetical protein
MRPNHTIANYAASRSGPPVTPPELAGEAQPVPPRPLTRVTFCFAWLFGLEPFLTGSTAEPPRPDSDRRA